MTMGHEAPTGKRDLARTLTALEIDPGEPGVNAMLDTAAGQGGGRVIGLTGPPGVGKSSLTDALVRALRRRDLTVAILAVDPSSARSGGALLGDRTRIETDPEDAGVFMRSMAARGRLGGLSDIAFPAIVLLRSRFDVVIVETVGVGQSEVEIAGAADRVVFCAQPGSGDALQFIKAGIMEIPDLIAVTKSDLGALAVRTLSDLKGAVSLIGVGTVPEVLALSAETGEGVEAALDSLLKPVDRQLLAERRSHQFALWVNGELVRLFGARGAELVRERLGNGPTNFSQLTGVKAEMEDALSRAFTPLREG